MRRLFSCLLAVIVVLVFTDPSPAQFPCYPGDSVGTDCCGADSGKDGYSWDLGLCDTLHVLPWAETDTCFISCFGGSCDTICINNPGEEFPCFSYVPLLVTHDLNTFWWEAESEFVQDSISAIVLPLVWTRTNPSAYCSLSGYWNENTMNPYDPRFPRSIFRHFQPSELDSNRMAWLYGQNPGLEWFAILHLVSDSSWYYFAGDSVFTPPRMWLGLVKTEPANRRWWEGERTLVATLTFRIEDTMHVCMDSTWWPPGNHLEFFRLDARYYSPRHNLPLCVWVGPSPHWVTSPNGGEKWCVGKSEEITWDPEGFPLAVKIDYSTSAGISWLPIEGPTPNDGSYFWTIPDTPSDRCLVRISDAFGGDPYDESDSLFTIFLAGDANADAVVDIGDIIYLINYLFMSGFPPAPLEAADVNLDGEIDTGDVIYLINFLFLDGPAPRC